MTKEEFEALTSRPSMQVSWGGKLYKLTSVDKKTYTCYLRMIGMNRKPYAVNYESVVLLKHLKRAPRAKQ